VGSRVAGGGRLGWSSPWPRAATGDPPQATRMVSCVQFPLCVLSGHGLPAWWRLCVVCSPCLTCLVAVRVDTLCLRGAFEFESAPANYSARWGCPQPAPRDLLFKGGAGSHWPRAAPHAIPRRLPGAHLVSYSPWVSSGHELARWWNVVVVCLPHLRWKCDLPRCLCEVRSDLKGSRPNLDLSCGCPPPVPRELLYIRIVIFISSTFTAWLVHRAPAWSSARPFKH